MFIFVEEAILDRKHPLIEDIDVGRRTNDEAVENVLALARKNF